MSQLYLQYIKHRNNGDDSAVAAVLASIKSLITTDMKTDEPPSAISQKERFKSYQKSFMALGNSIDPAAGA
jgi:hypothetical protein